MPAITIDLSEIVELATDVATAGAIRAGQVVSDDVFEQVIAVAMLIYEMTPNG